MNGPTAERGRLALRVDDLAAAVDRLVDLGFRLREIGPADEPTSAELEVDGLRIRVHTATEPGGRPGTETATPPITVELYDSNGPLPAGADPAGLGDLAEVAGLAGLLAPGPDEGPEPVPRSVQRLVVSHEADGDWVTGRAGMRYRDLIPERHGGAFIASHIHVPGSGPVPDFVHHHDIAFQMIFCHRGRVRLVYEDQGEPFVMAPGDCVLQPPGIRHRVLESFDDLHVVEITCPAVHRTFIDHETELPTPDLRPDRDFGGQRFVRFVAADQQPEPVVDVGLAAATNGLARAGVHRGDVPLEHDADLLLAFVLTGRAELTGSNADDPGSGSGEPLVAGSSVAVPPRSGRRLTAPAPDTTVLRVEVGPI